jgi:type VI secretion system secreted protein VgrG
MKCGGNFVSVTPAGVTISGTMVMINSGGAAGSGAGCTVETPKDPKEADNAQSGQATARRNPPPPPNPNNISALNATSGPGAKNPTAAMLAGAAQNGTPFCACNC